MATMIKGITVNLYEMQETGTNAFNEAIYAPVKHSVANVLVTPATEQEILDWFNARQEVVGELFVFNRDHCCSPSCVSLRISHPLDGFVRYPSHETKRYLIKVGDAERVLVLHPFPDGFLEWRVKGVLEMIER